MTQKQTNTELDFEKIFEQYIDNSVEKIILEIDTTDDDIKTSLVKIKKLLEKGGE